MLYPELLHVPAALLSAAFTAAILKADGQEVQTQKVDVLDFGLGFIHAAAVAVPDLNDAAAISTA